MKEMILFVLCFFTSLFIYEIFIVKKAKKKRDKKPIEVTYLIKKYKIDLRKANYTQLLQIVSLTSSFDIALIVSLVCMTNNYWIELLVAIFSSIPIILISYHFVGNFYKKRGMIKNV